MITLTFLSVAEKKPEHGEQIIYLKEVGSSFAYGFEPTETTAEFCWFELDEHGEMTGNQVCYTPGEDITADGYRLELLLDGYIAGDDWHWINVEDYWKAILRENYVPQTPESDEAFERYATLDEQNQ